MSSLSGVSWLHRKTPAAMWCRALQHVLPDLMDGQLPILESTLEDSCDNMLSCSANELSGWMVFCESWSLHPRTPTTTSVEALRRMLLIQRASCFFGIAMLCRQFRGLLVTTHKVGWLSDVFHCLMSSRSFPNLIRSLFFRSLPNLIGLLRKSPASTWRRAPRHELPLILIACHLLEVSCDATNDGWQTVGSGASTVT